MTPFAIALKKARKDAGLTQKEMAERTLIPFRTLQDWEHGKRTPPEYVQRFVLKELSDIILENKMDALLKACNQRLKERELPVVDEDLLRKACAELKEAPDSVGEAIEKLAAKLEQEVEQDD
jgi:transcriptional regulator with XRE-family HTH domain